jgi:hypothetical protein
MAIYKEVPATDHKNRIIRDLTSDKVTAIKSIVGNFITYFKASV